MLFAGIGLNRGAGFAPFYSSLAKTNLPHAIQMFSSKRGKDFDVILSSSSVSSSKKRSIKSFQPKTENQKKFLDLMRNDSVDIVIAIGPAGTGKTMLACYSAVEALRLGKVNKVVVTRPVVSVDEEIGFLPGGLESKMDPWTRPIFDVFRETYSAKDIDKMTEEGIIEIVPLGFMRGRTFKHAWIIADEMQNSSPTQMFMLATRIGEGSKMIITGDLNQSDLNPKSNGLLEIYNKVLDFEKSEDLDCVQYVELDKEDVQRSRAAKSILNIYDPIPSSCRINDRDCKIDTVKDEYEPLPLGYSNYDGENQFTNEFEYLDRDVVSNIESSGGVEGGVSGGGDGGGGGTETPNCFSPKDWVIYNANDNDAALIPLRHISKNYRL